ncbi:crotonase/enoyl-CoA hydratase family protein [Microbaculum sp. FT89]|uniref:crotonase/enoyl-CoA hydratase family protein n=1 Tax=Microbaculum sp. FT89 TaxID=3447298 RepID=UPI003F52E503
MSSFVSVVDRSFSRKQPSPSKDRLAPVQPAAPASDSTERPLFGLEQLEVNWEEDTGTLWTFMRPHNRPSYNPEFLKDFEAWQTGIQSMFAGQEGDLRYLVLGSRWPGVYSLGGDLDLFARHIRDRDREALVDYGRTCVRILHRNIETLDLPVVTIALAQGDALGGGFESLLSFNVIVAERGIKFGFPESLFGLFPGMGAYSLLARRIGAAKAEEMILSGNSFTAEQMHEVGLVHILAEPGEGVEATRAYIQKQKWRRNGSRAVYMTGRQVDPLPLEELERIVEIWADACLQLSDRDLRLMERLVAAQDRLRSFPLAAE